MRKNSIIKNISKTKRINNALCGVKDKRSMDNALIIGAVLAFSLFLLVFASLANATDLLYQTDQTQVSAFSPKSDKPMNGLRNGPVEAARYSRIDEHGGLVLVDGTMEITQQVQADKQIDLIGITTPTYTLATNHSNLWLNNTAKQLCARFDDASSGCLALGGSLSGYLTTVAAASTYLTQSSATATYGQLGGKQTWTAGNTFSSATFTTAPRLTTVTNTVLAADSSGVIISTTIASGSGVLLTDTPTWTGVHNWNNTAYSTFTAVSITNLRIGSNTAYVLLYSSMICTSGVTSTTSSTYQTATPAITITPKSVNSRIRVWSNAVIRTGDGSATNVMATLFRDSTNIASTYGGASTDICDVQSGNAAANKAPCKMEILDLPATISAVTYAPKVKNGNNSTSVNWNGGTAGVACTGVEEFNN